MFADVWVCTGCEGHQDDLSVSALNHHNASAVVTPAHYIWLCVHLSGHVTLCQEQEVCCDYQETGRCIQE